MEIITYSIESEIEATRIASLLDEREIPYTIKKNSDLFPYNGDRRGFGEIMVLREFERDVRAIFDEIEKTRNSQSQEDQSKTDSSPAQKPGRRRLWQSVLIAYSLIVTILLIKYWDMNRKNSISKNFIYAWSYNNAELTIRNKKNQQLIEINTDANENFNFEKSEAYANNNKLTARSLDFNEDGFIDETTFFGRNGKISGLAFDHDGDGWFEESTTFLENGDTLKFTDKNVDGFYELEQK